MRSSARARRYRPLIWLVSALLVLGAGAAAGDPAAADRTDTGTYGVPGLDYTYRAFVPAGLPEHPALLVMIHGCRTTAEQQQRANLLDPLARRAGFVVLYVDGTPLHRLQDRCWSGLLTPALESRTTGDAAAIAAMTRAAAERYGADPHRIYALGMSSGAFETALLGAYFPDLFAAVGLHSGAAFGHGVLGCVGPALPGAATEQLAAQAFSAQGGHRRVVPMIAVRGDADTTVSAECGEQAVAQWRATGNMTLAAQGVADRIPSEPMTFREGEVPGGHGYTVRTWDAPGASCPVLQAWTVHGMGHFWSGGADEPDLAEFTDPRGPSASVAAWAFFSRIERTADGFSCRPPDTVG
ncbi:alpha/beta hydrolase family esterase [Nocardia sp. NPDC057668]|uniref:extracellular catalytic domain type 1 short-chain-length polyhydroxyalkanoate depolymerase n=1 Tax=Nocardia sp. NPDC057668 TaxID=3346202 RepID=UPI003671CE9C